MCSTSNMNGRNLRFLRTGVCVLAFYAGVFAQQPSQRDQAPAPEARQENPSGQPASTSPQAEPVTAETKSVANESSGLAPTADPKEIVRRAIETDHRTLELMRSYTCQDRRVIKNLDKNGDVKSTEIKTFEINFFYGKEYWKLLQVDDHPLSEKEQKKEDEKLDKFLAKLRNESESDREKRLEKERKQREEGRAFVREVIRAYDFRLLGEEKVDGVDGYVIQATPRPDFEPIEKHADMFKKIKGRLWIEKQNYNWVKVDAETTDTISFGLFLFRIHPGSKLMLEKSLMNNEVWLLKDLKINGGARIALLKNASVEQEDTVSHCKKYVTSVKILPGVKEVPETEPK